MPAAGWFQGTGNNVSIKKTIPRTGKKSDDGVMGNGSVITNKNDHCGCITISMWMFTV